MKGGECDASNVKINVSREHRRGKRSLWINNVGTRRLHWSQTVAYMWVTSDQIKGKECACVSMCIYPIMDVEVIRDRYWGLRGNSDPTTFTTQTVRRGNALPFSEVNLLGFYWYIWILEIQLPRLKPFRGNSRKVPYSRWMHIVL